MEEGREYIDSTIKLIEEGKKYKKMWEKLYEDYGMERLNMCFEEKLSFIMDALKLKYFPKKVIK